MGDPVPLDVRIARIAAAHNRVVTWTQLVDAGLGRRSVAHRVATARLYRSHTGVYLLEPPGTATRVTLLTAAVAACGGGAILSHRSAAELWGLLPPRPGDIDVTVMFRNPGVKPGIRRHRTTSLSPADIRTKRGIRVTSPARTVIDATAYLNDDDLEDLIATAFRENLASDRQLLAAIARFPTHLGAARVSAVLDLDGGPAWTRAKTERLMLSLVRQARLPVPLTNVPLHGGEVDFLWPDQRLVVETDGYKFHRDRVAFENDRARDAIHVAAGYRVLRFTWRQLRDEPLVVIGRLAAALALTPR